MRLDYEIQEEIDDYSGAVEYIVNGYVDGELFGVIGSARTLLDAHFLGKCFNPNLNDARIK